MTDSDKQKELTRYRMQQAEESLDEARFLLSGDPLLFRFALHT